MNIGILGAGNIGGNLGQLWSRAGYTIMYGVRDPNSAKSRAALEGGGSGAHIGSLAEAAAFGEVVALALPWPAVVEALPMAGDLSGKVLIDCTNRLAPASAGSAPSGAEEVARLAPGARVVKAFNTMGFETLLAPQFGQTSVTTFVCADDEEAKQIVMKLAADIGLDPVDAGPLANAGLTEQLTRMWIQLSRIHGRDVAYKLLRR
jgi:predicted dinucleotide-binding enzyme